MLTQREILHAIIVPIAVAAIVAAIGAWRRWKWAVPAGAGLGYLIGFALLGIPRFPPRDGTDWLFWIAIPLILLALIDAITNWRWGWLLGAAGAAATVVLLLWPLVPRSVPVKTMVLMAIVFAAAAALLCLIIKFSEERIGAVPVLLALCITIGGAAVVILASRLRIVGVYGICASAALGPVALLSARPRGARSVAIFAVPVLIGLLTGGYCYPDKGVSAVNFSVLIAAPTLLLLGTALPIQKKWIRGALALIAVLIAVAVVTMPTAMAAKREVENDPYAAYQ